MCHVCSPPYAVQAAYAYIYSLLNLLLVAVMVVCNLVVVVTLARVRDYRRKHSTSSTNAVISADMGADDQYRQQARDNVFTTDMTQLNSGHWTVQTVLTTVCATEWSYVVRE
ncbi:hypothetical protein Btru_062442 [Bulinus truncatus]|nr:hypothetical protein Btru_062442 [Bulinus truncatus]